MKKGVIISNKKTSYTGASGCDYRLGYSLMWKKYIRWRVIILKEDNVKYLIHLINPLIGLNGVEMQCEFWLDKSHVKII